MDSTKGKRKLLFSLTKKDFEMQTFRSGGKGGQNQNKRDTGVRFVHRESGATGEARDGRTQLINKKSAFSRLTKSKKFQIWLRIEISKRNGEYVDMEKRVNKLVNESMKEENIKVEYF